MKVSFKATAVILSVRILVVRIEIRTILSFFSTCLMSLASASALARLTCPLNPADRLLLIAHEVLSSDILTGALLMVQEARRSMILLPWSGVI